MPEKRSRHRRLRDKTLPYFFLTFALHLAGTASGEEAVEIRQLLDNPADLSTDYILPETLFYVGGGLYADDREDLLDDVFQVTREADALDAKSRGLLLIPGDEAELVDAMQEIDGNRSSLRAGGGIVLAYEGESQIAWVFSSQFNATGRFYYDEGDEQRLRYATITGLFRPLELQSHMRVSAIWQSYIGLNYRFKLSAFPNTEFGVTPKLQNISLVERRINQSDYVENEVFRFNRDINHRVQLNADLGLRHQLGALGLQLVYTDVYNEEYEGVDGTRYRQRGQLSAGLDYRKTRGEVSLRAELTPSGRFGEEMPRRDIALNGRLKIAQRFDLTAGYTVVEDHFERNFASLGFRYSLGLLRLDVSGQASGTRELGFQLGAQLPL